jgi:hypothetical protein
VAVPTVLAPDALAQVENDWTTLIWHLTYFSAVGVFGEFGRFESGGRVYTRIVIAERHYGASSIVVRFPGQKDMVGRNSEPAVGVAQVFVLD